MPRTFAALAILGIVSLAACSRPAPAEPLRLPLRTGWQLQSSARLPEKGDVLSRPDYRPSTAWAAVTVPNTVLGALVDNGTYTDPYFGMNLRNIPGTTYPIGERFTLLPMPADSPFKPSWWYRRAFDLPGSVSGRTIWLRLDGLNYRANIWVNGTRVAAADEVVGVFRQYEFDISKLARPGQTNALAAEVIAPEPHDLSIMWVDWNPTPADKNMGLWGEVSVTDSGPIALRHPYVQTKLDLPGLGFAQLTVTTDILNTTDRPITGMVRGAIDTIRFSRSVSLTPHQRTSVRFTPTDVPGLRIQNPRVWWPYRYGAQPQYDLAVDADVDGVASDHQDVRFGIQEMSSELTAEGHRLFKVNGRPILIRGGGWASDMLLRPASTARLEAELRYVREMGLNTVRLEGKLESDEFYDLADRYGILVMPGWCCCDQWEKWDQWDAEDHRVGPASLRDQALRLRNHPSVLAWFNGSDFPPPAGVERAYLDVLDQCAWSKPVLSNASEAPGPVSGPSGVKMRGPYDYVPPSYWLTDKKNGGAFGFSTEIGPGGAVPPIESLRTMMPPDRLWPINEFWTFHAGGDEFKDLTLFTGALEGRYGKATGAEDYARKAQALAYEGQRAMFEGYARNKYTSTGVIQWMLNNAWPSMIWHLYDYYLRPGGGYYGTKKACELVHVQYSYDDRSVVVVNDGQDSFRNLKVSAQVLDFGLVSKFSRDATIDLAPDGVLRALVVPPLAGLTTTYFLRLSVADSSGRTLSTNFYWLSTRDDVLDWKNTQWYYTPTKSHADLRALAQLAPTTIRVSSRFEEGTPEEGAAQVRVENTGRALAFQVHLKLLDAASGEEILPVFWDDNYVAILPGEVRDIRVSYPRTQQAARPSLEVDGWNVARERVK